MLDCCALTAEYRDRLRTSLRVITPTDPDDEPITLEEAWRHLRIDAYGSPLASDDDDWLLNIGIPAARQWAEGYTGLALAPQTLELVADTFPEDYFELAGGPVQSVQSIDYIDDASSPQPQVFTDYQLNIYADPPRLSPATGFTWPVGNGAENSVRVRYVVGYSRAGYSPLGYVLPPRLKIGLLLLLGHLYENREDTSTLNLNLIPNGARSFLDFDRLRRGFA